MSKTAPGKVHGSLLRKQSVCRNPKEAGEAEDVVGKESKDMGGL